MDRTKIYAGPGKLFMSTISLWPEGENGQIGLTFQQEDDAVATAIHGFVDETQADAMVKVTVNPFDLWDALPVLWPTYIRTPAPGTRIFGAADVPCKVWSPDGRIYDVKNVAVTKHPELSLGVGTPLFGDIELTGLIANNKNYGDADGFLTITESNGADPGGQMAMTNFVRGRWTGVWGTDAGWGGEAEGVAVEAADKWTITPEVKYDFLKVGKLSRSAKLASVRIMAKCRPVGPTHTQILAATKAQAGGVLGGRRGTDAGGKTLVLTGPGGKTITLNGAMLKGAGFNFGGTELGTGEVGWVATASFTAGVLQPHIVFSA